MPSPWVVERERCHRDSSEKILYVVFYCLHHSSLPNTSPDARPSEKIWLLCPTSPLFASKMQMYRWGLPPSVTDSDPRVVWYEDWMACWKHAQRVKHGSQHLLHNHLILRHCRANLRCKARSWASVIGGARPLSWAIARALRGSPSVKRSNASLG